MRTPQTQFILSRHYLPLLARYIVEKNTVAPPEDKINLKGFLVGNPSTVGLCGCGCWFNSLTVDRALAGARSAL